MDASYLSQPDMKSHMGSFLSLVTGGVMSGSNKYKVNYTSATESEVITCSDCSCKGILYSKLFLWAQGYTLSTTVHQDSESAIKLEKMVVCPAVKELGTLTHDTFKSKIWWKGRLGITIEHCPTELMIANFFTMLL